MVELVLVVGVLVVLSAVVLVTMQVPKYRGQAHNIQRKTDVRTMHEAFLLMARDKDDYTTGLPTSPTCIGTGSASPFNLKGISWTVNPSDTAMKFNVRACADSTCSADPLWLISSPDYYSPTSIDIPNASYFQYKATFNNVLDSAWTQTTNEEFNGTNASTIVNNGRILIRLNDLTNNSVPSLDLSLGSATGGCSGTGLSWSSPICTITGNAYEFSSINIPNGTTLKVTGGTKLTLKSQGDTIIAGTISLEGSSGTIATYGTANNGGGGNGGPHTGTGQSVGPGGVGGGSVQTGGGFGGAGGSGGGAAYPTPYNNDSGMFYGGSGGGGGNGYSGSGGGAGGGAIRIISNEAIVINSTGIINAYGGVGGSKGGAHGAGGGAGGGALFQARSITNGGIINAYGGKGGDSSGGYWSGSGGGGGRVRLETCSGSNITVGNTYVQGGAAGTSGGNTQGPGGNGTSIYGVTIGSNAITCFNSGAYTSLSHDLIQSANFTTISWNRTDANDGEITLGDTNLKGLWHLNETTGTNAPDSAGVNSLATNGATWSSSSFKFGGKALSFNGNAYAQKASPTNLDIGAANGNWTLEAWVKPSSAGSGAIRTIISKYAASAHYYDLKLNTNNQVVAGLYDPDGDKAEATSNILSADNWHHIVAVFTKSGSSTGTVQIYIDGEKDSDLASNPSLPSNMSNAAAFRIGQRNDGTLGFNGEIDEVAFWSKALTAPPTDCATDESLIDFDKYQYEICQHYNKGFGIPHLKFQARSCNDALCDTETFIGPDGTASTYYNSIGNYGSNSTLNLTANQWVQYKADFATSDTSQTPSLDSISIRYNTSEISKPKLEDITITASLDSAGKNQVNLLYSGYGDFVGAGIKTCSTNTALSCSVDGDCPSGGTCQSKISPINSLKILDEGSIEYQGGSAPTYTSPVFSTQCFDIGPVLVPEYLPVVPKDPKIGTDENTGYFFSANSEMGTVTISAPAAELGEIIRN